MGTVFLGSGEFSRDLLSELLRAGFACDAVITRPDHPAGRGLRLRSTALKSFAADEDIKVYQPSGPKDPDFLTALQELRPEFLLVADYGEILPRTVLEYPPKGCVNVHPSLLPRYRGAAPIQRALMMGESTTGVALMVLDEGMDTGAIIVCEEIPIDPMDDAATLRRKLASLGARMVIEWLPRYLAGAVVPHPQDDEYATYADAITKSETLIDWALAAPEIHNRVRALNPHPGAYAWLRGKRLKILRTAPREEMMDIVPGTLGILRGGTLVVGTGKGALCLMEVQPEGKRPMSIDEFLRGYRLKNGESFDA